MSRRTTKSAPKNMELQEARAAINSDNTTRQEQLSSDIIPLNGIKTISSSKIDWSTPLPIRTYEVRLSSIKKFKHFKLLLEIGAFHGNSTYYDHTVFHRIPSKDKIYKKLVKKGVLVEVITEKANPNNILRININTVDPGQVLTVSGGGTAGWDTISATTPAPDLFTTNQLVLDSSL